VGTEAFEAVSTVGDILPVLLAGVPVTLAVTAVALALAMPTAFALALLRMSLWRIARWPATAFVELFRGTPALIQLFWAYYVLPFFGVQLPPLAVGVLVLGLNEGSYFSEVVRASLNSVAAGQRDAVVSLHLPRRYVFFRIVLPQALPLMVAPFGNTAVGMLKMSALVSLVTLHDIAFRANVLRATLASSELIYFLTLVIYFILALCIAFAVSRLERRVHARSGRAAAQARAAIAASSSVPSWAFGR
jgi:polar amino acid transport system permease protein